MAASTVLFTIILLFLGLSDSSLEVQSLSFGINYGQIANNLPSPSRVAVLLQSLNVSRIKLYDADPNVLQAFANSEVDFIIGLGNEYLQSMSTDPLKAQSWIQQHVQPHLPQTKITCINVGNEVLGGTDTQLWSYLLPAMQSVYRALVNLGLSKQVAVTTAHSLTILGKSYPPSSGSFRQDLAQYIQPILSFHSQVNSPFLINAYPYFAYKDNPGEVSIDYVLFQPNSGMVDSVTNLHKNQKNQRETEKVREKFLFGSRKMVMAKSKLSYEESRQQRLEENKKRMEALNLPMLAQALNKTPNSPKPSPMKSAGKPRTYEVQMVEVRRSTRVANRPAPDYKEVVAERVMIPRRSYATNRHRDVANRVYASDEARAAAMVKADELEASLGSDHPTLVKTMLQSHVTGGFWLGLQVSFCKNHLPKGDEVMTLIDEDGDEYPTIYLARKTGLSGGWKGFAVAHDLVDGDALVFQLIRPTTFKVYIIRVERPGQASSEGST